MMSVDFNFVLMLTDDFIIKRKVLTPDGVGGFSSVLTQIGGTIKGRLDDETSSETPRARQDVEFIKERLFVLPGTDIKREDQVEGLGRTFRVRYFGTVHEDHLLEVICEEIDP